jgi:hypothetical protein
MIEKDGKVYLKRTAPLGGPTSREGISANGDSWLVDSLPDTCYVCGEEIVDKHRLTNKCDKCIELTGENGIVE